MNNEVQLNLLETTLKQYRENTIKSILTALPSKEPKKYLYDYLASYFNKGGKGIRSGLCIATCRALGGNYKKAMNSAAIIELLHNSFLIRDDIEDASEFRHGKSALYIELGVGNALNLSDAMNALSVRMMMNNRSVLGSEMSWEIFSEIEHMVSQTVEGQAIELGWIKDNIIELTEDDYLRMVLKKTSWYTTIHPCRIGALIALGSDYCLDNFNHFGCYLGAAFQIQDDILNLIGDYKKYRKEICGDILEGKRTVMLIHTLNQCTEAEKKRIQIFLGKSRNNRTPKDVELVLKLMKRYDSIEHARSCSRQLAGAALLEFYTAYKDAPDSNDKSLLYSMVMYIIERNK